MADRKYQQQLSRKEEDAEKNRAQNVTFGMERLYPQMSFAQWNDPFGMKRNIGANIYAKMEVSQPGDPSEVQADNVADAVMRGSVEDSQLEMEKGGSEIMAKGSGMMMDTPSGFEEKMNSMKGGGVPLSDEKQETLGEHMNADLSDVRLHTGADAKELSESIDARAFASGQDIFFADDANDEELLAHEVVHTVQDGEHVQGKIRRQEKKTEVIPDPETRISFSIPFEKDMNLEDSMIHIIGHIYGVNPTNAKRVVEKIKTDYGSLSSFWKDRPDGSHFDGLIFDEKSGKTPQYWSVSLLNRTYSNYKSFLTGEKETDVGRDEEKKEQAARRFDELKKKIESGDKKAKEEFEALSNETDKRFRELTGFKGNLDPKNPDHAEYIKIWMELFDEISLKKRASKGDYSAYPNNVSIFLEGRDMLPVSDMNYADFQRAVNLLSQLKAEELSEYDNLPKRDSIGDWASLADSLDFFNSMLEARKALFATFSEQGESTVSYFEKAPPEGQLMPRTKAFLQDVFYMDPENLPQLIDQIKETWKKDKSKAKYISWLDDKNFVERSFARYVAERKEQLDVRLIKDRQSQQPEKTLAEIKQQIVGDATKDAQKRFTEEDKKVYGKVNEMNQLYIEAFVSLSKEGKLELIDILSIDSSKWLQLLKNTPEYEKIQKLTTEIKAIRGTYRLAYDPVSGNRIDKAETPQQKEYEGKVISELKKLEDPSYRGQLQQSFIEFYSQYKTLDVQMDYPFFRPFDNYEADEQYEKGTKLNTPRDFVKHLPSFHIKWQEHHGQLVRNLNRHYLDAQARFDAVARVYLLNEDPGYVERESGFTAFIEGVVEGFGGDYKTDQDFVEAFGVAMQEQGIGLTLAQQERIKKTFAQKLGYTLGAAIPAILELIVTTLITEGLGTIPAIARAGTIIRAAFITRFPKYGERLYKIFVSTTKGMTAFGLADAGAIRGAGFGAGMAISEELNPFKVFLSNTKFGKFASLFFQVGFSTLTQTATVYVSDYFQLLVDNGFDYKKAFFDTFGRDFDEAKDKLLLTTLVSALFSGAGNKTLVLNLKRVIENTSEKVIALKDKIKIMEIIRQRLAAFIDQVAQSILLNKAKLTLDEVRSLLPVELIEAIKSLGKSEAEILKDYQAYHGKDGFFKLIESRIKKYGIDRLHAHAIWSYTNNFFYLIFNEWMRKGINPKLTDPLKKLLLDALDKMPSYAGEAYRAIRLDGAELLKFLNEHKVKNTVTANEFLSLGSTPEAGFFNKPTKNIFIKFEKITGHDISNFSDGVAYRDRPPIEILTKPGKQYEVLSYNEKNGKHYLTVKEK